MNSPKISVKQALGATYRAAAQIHRPRSAVQLHALVHKLVDGDREVSIDVQTLLETAPRALRMGESSCHRPIVDYTTLYDITLHYAILHYMMLYYTILYYTILYCTVLYYTILYYTILYYTVLYYTISWQ